MERVIENFVNGGDIWFFVVEIFVVVERLVFVFIW